MDRCVMKHRARNRHDGADGSFSNSIAVVCSNTRVSYGLLELAEMRLKIRIAKGCAIVAKIFLYNHTVGGAH